MRPSGRLIREDHTGFAAAPPPPQTNVPTPKSDVESAPNERATLEIVTVGLNGSFSDLTRLSEGSRRQRHSPFPFCLLLKTL